MGSMDRLEWIENSQWDHLLGLNGTKTVNGITGQAFMDSQLQTVSLARLEMI